MCPMHRNQKSRHDKMPCQGANSSPVTCVCAPSQPSQAMVPSVALYGIVPIEPSGVYQPPIGGAVVVVRVVPILVRSVSPPDQPPRQ